MKIRSPDLEDEFVIVISHYDNIKESLSITTTIAKKIIADLSTPFDINDREIYSTASIGIACYPTDGQTTNELIKMQILLCTTPNQWVRIIISFIQRY